jgi:hypothetical protein
MTPDKEAVARAVAEMSVSEADRMEAERRSTMGGLSKASQDPDIPACDACGREFSANLSCGACQSAFYCTKICQTNAWKYGRHKQECPDMREQCQQDAQRAVQALSRRSTEDCEALEGTDLLECLNGAGAYKAAVQEGFHEALCGLFRNDADGVMELFRSEGSSRWSTRKKSDNEDEDGGEDAHVWAATRTVTCSLFRGQRAEGRAVKNRSFGYVDGQRIKTYIISSSQAFDVCWMHLWPLYDCPLTTLFGDGEMVSKRMRTVLHEIPLPDGF